MFRFLTALLILIAVGLTAPHEANALLGISVKAGAGFIPNGRVPGGILGADIGPIAPFAEIFRKSGTTTVNLGGNLIFKLPLPMVKPYGGAGGGISRSSGGGISKSRALFDLVAGVDLKLSGMSGLFGQIKYLYTFGSGAFVVREVAIQAGILFSLGL